MAKQSYKTAGRQALVDYLGAHPDRRFSVEELLGALGESGCVTQSSLYRHLSELAEAGHVRRTTGEGRSYYQYTGAHAECERHLHGTCFVCGRVEHLSCEEIDELKGHLQRDHGFTVSLGRSVLYGVCAACREREDQHA